ncbi:MAG: T9SS type A sorting domain-containing protein [Lewinellaceae bacterium]|nr:T9SS type A sorting domain-containing protein [Lewinellaceae bacterium]
MNLSRNIKMISIKKISQAILFMSLLYCFNFTVAQTPAFPGADGGGKYVSGGRGGSVYEVTNLNDSGSGSLRDAISQPNRTIVFRVSGVINLKSKLSFKKDNITVAGQTAPGDGICITGYPVNISANNLILRYLRFRMGDVNKVEDDALNCFSGGYKNIIIDHCSMSWGLDEVASFYDVKNFTLQWSIISESLYDSYHSKGKHGYGGIWGGENTTYHHNLIAHHTSRTPRLNGTRYSSQKYGDSLEFCNNVIYNWGNINSVYGGEGGKYNMINNYYKAGPATPGNLTSSGSSNKRNRILNYTSYYVDNTDTIWGGDFYINGNYVHGYPDVTADNWTKGVQKDSWGGATALIAKAKKTTSYSISDYVSESATDAYDNIAKGVGAIIPKRDDIDKRIIQEMLNGVATFEGSGYASVTSTGVSHPSGIIDKPDDVGGLPAYQSLPAPLDTDHDGMPDQWEIDNGLNPNDATDRNTVGADGYTELEHYINSIAEISSATSESTSKSDITVYPNPSQGQMYILIPEDIDVQSMIVYDLMGKVIKTYDRTTINNLQNHVLDLGTLDEGEYVLRFDTSKGIIGKVVIFK